MRLYETYALEQLVKSRRVRIQINRWISTCHSWASPNSDFQTLSQPPRFSLSNLGGLRSVRRTEGGLNPPHDPLLHLCDHLCHSVLHRMQLRIRVKRLVPFVMAHSDYLTGNDLLSRKYARPLRLPQIRRFRRPHAGSQNLRHIEHEICSRRHKADINVT